MAEDSKCEGKVSQRPAHLLRQVDPLVVEFGQVGTGQVVAEGTGGSCRGKTVSQAENRGAALKAPHLQTTTPQNRPAEPERLNTAELYRTSWWTGLWPEVRPSL